MVRKSIFGIIVIVIVLGILNLPLIETQEPYAVLESYKESYSTVEIYKHYFTYRVIDTKLEESYDVNRGVFHIMSISVLNRHTDGEQFLVELRLYDKDGLFGRKTVRNHIGAGSITTFSAEFDTEEEQYVRGEYTVFPPIYEEQKSVNKTKTAYRLVTRYNTIKKSHIDLWFGI